MGIHFVELGPRQTKIGRQKKSKAGVLYADGFGEGTKFVDYCASHINV